MSPLRTLLFLLLAFRTALPWAAGADSAPAPAANAFEIREGDRVVFLGDTLLEREGTYGFLETRMAEQFPGRHFTVRNLSWSGDTPLGVSRAMFDGPAKGWERLKEQIATEKPTVVFLGYGMAASLQEMADLSGDITMNPDPARYGREPMSAARFKKELGLLMDAITAVSKDARVVLLSPITHEDLRPLRPGLPDPVPHNRLIEAYSAAIAEVAREHGARFVSLKNVVPVEPLRVVPGSVPRRMLNLPDGEASRLPLLQQFPLTTNGIHLGKDGYRALAVVVGQELGWKPQPDPNHLDLIIAEVSAYDPLRQTIIRKNQLFFHRFRPENWTYLFGFRVKEQGKNAAEIPKFDPLIAHEEQEIDRLKKAPVERYVGALMKKDSAPAEKAPGPPPPVSKELPKFDVEKGFEIQLWASNPLIEKPIEMNWDSDGRLWIASSNTYPQVNPEDVAASLEADIARGKKDAPSSGNDKILVVEDPDHTGKATKSSVFAEGLLIPTGVAPFRDAAGHWGCYVGASTELLQLVDTKDTGKADERRIILSGFGTEDTHHIVHTLRWAPDGRLNFDQSIYVHSHFETPWGMVRLNSGGVLAWDSRTERVEVRFKGFCNPWGHAWDEWGQEFVTDGAGFEGVCWCIPGAMYFTYENGRRILQSISPGTYPKFASLEIVHSPLFPDDWQGSFITNDFRAHRIVHFGVTDLAKTDDPAKAQSGYVTKELPDLVRTSDLSFRPIDVKHGPDGALYIADWSNPVINHGEVDFRDPRRDHYSGRIWRIALKDKQPLAWEKLTEKPAEAMAGKMQSNSKWEKEQAMQVDLRKRPGGWSAALTPWLNRKKSATASKESPDDRVLEARFMGMAIWEKKWLHNSSALETTEPSTFQATLARLAADPGPRVRVEAMRALARAQYTESPGLILDAALRAPPNDPFYEYAAWLSINDLAEPWTKAVISGEWKIEGNEKQLEFGLNAIEPALASNVLAKVMATHTIPPDGGPWIDLVSKAGGPAELRKIFDALTTQHLNPAASEHAIEALREAARLRNARPEGDLTKIEPLLANPNIKVGAGAARLIGTWKLPNALETLNGLATDKNRAGPSAELRLAAIEGLREIGGEKALANLRALLTPDQTLEIRRAALVAATQVNVKAGIAAAGAVLASIPNENAALETWRTLLQVKGAPDAFAAKLPENLPPAVLAAGLRAAREAGKPGAGLAKALAAKTGAKPEAPAGGQDFKPMVDLVKRDGDPARGETVFRRAQLACVTCHAIGGAGGKVGPDLTSLGASAPLDYIIESVVVPNAKVKEGFNAVSLTLKDGTVAAGIQSRETPQEIFLRNATGQETSVPKANIVGRENIGSLMPAGLVDPLPERERVDLYAFLSQLGKPGVYDASKGNVARFWQLAPADGDASASVPGGAAAVPAYTLVDGRLTREMLQAALPLVPNAQKGVLATAKFQAPSAGPVKISLTGAAAASIDGKPLTADAQGQVTAEVAPGEHRLAVKIDVKQLPESLRAECPEVRFLGN